MAASWRNERLKRTKSFYNPTSDSDEATRPSNLGYHQPRGEPQSEFVPVDTSSDPDHQEQADYSGESSSSESKSKSASADEYKHDHPLNQLGDRLWDSLKYYIFDPNSGSYRLDQQTLVRVRVTNSTIERETTSSGRIKEKEQTQTTSYEFDQVSNSDSRMPYNYPSFNDNVAPTRKSQPPISPKKGGKIQRIE